jgi:hypothetical protein
MEVFHRSFPVAYIMPCFDGNNDAGRLFVLIAGSSPAARSTPAPDFWYLQFLPGRDRS